MSEDGGFDAQKPSGLHLSKNKCQNNIQNEHISSILSIINQSCGLTLK
jgi:hypothetical protein